MDAHRQAVADFLHVHDRLTTWDGLAASVSKLLGYKGRLHVSKKDAYGELGSYLHRIALDQQQHVMIEIKGMIQGKGKGKAGGR